MKAAQNYENSAQFLQKSLKRSEKKGVNHYRKERRQRKHSKFDNSSTSSGLDMTTSNFESSESDPGIETRNRNQGHGSSQERKGKSIVKVKTKVEK